MGKKHKNVQHLGIIMDGNRRWAQSHGLPIHKGHEQGAETLRIIAKACQQRGIDLLTVFALSTENLTNREAQELGFLFKLMKKAFTEEIKEFVESEIKINVLGRRDGLPTDLVTAIEQAESQTTHCTKGMVQFCINYGGRTELVDAVKQIIAAGVAAPAITEQTITDNLYYPDTPNPDLIIRTSGEHRVSNFLMWQSAYSELYFTDVHWPAFSETDLDAALDAFAHRDRRFGGN